MSQQCAAGVADPCVKLDKATHGLPRSGFDWFAHAGRVLMEELGWSRAHGAGSVYTKPEAKLAMHVDDCVMAGRPHAWRRDWPAIVKRIKLGGGLRDMAVSLESSTRFAAWGCLRCSSALRSRSAQRRS